jgi:hypothetical protein
MAKPMRKLERTPPRPQKQSPVKENNFGADEGAMVSRDEPVVTVKPTRGPVRRSPPRIVENTVSQNSAQKPVQDTPYIQDNFHSNSHKKPIEKKEKLRRSPVDPHRGPALIEAPPPRISEKQHSIPLNVHPVSLGKDFRNSPNITEEYEQLSPQKQHPYYHQTPKTFQHTHDTSELNTFEDRVDDLL